MFLLFRPHWNPDDDDDDDDDYDARSMDLYVTHAG